MPIYEYQCQDCHTQFEVIRPMKEANATLSCIKCQSNHVKRQISLFNAASEGRTLSGSSSCSGCSSNTCSTCGSN